MANPDFPRGAQPLRYQNGRRLACEYIKISSSNGQIDKDDILELRSDGFAHRAQATSTTIIGIAAEYKAANAGGKIAYYPAPGLVFLMQSDDASVAAQTNLQLNYDIIPGSASTTKLSVMELDGSTGATTATLPLKALKLYENQGETVNAFGANAVLECVFNATAFNGGGNGV